MDKSDEIKKKRFNKKSVKDFLFDFMIIVIGCISGGFSSIAIMLPNGLTSGGITGISRIIMNYCDISFSVLYYVAALTVLILCFFVLGKKEAGNIVLLTILYPSIMFVMEHIPNLILLEETDMTLASVYCGVFGGLSSGLVFSRGYSFGGTDTIAKMIKKKFLPQIDLSKILMVLDACIIIGSGLVYGRNIALYALITTVISTKVIEFVMFGLETKIVKMEIISKEYNEIAQYIMTDLERGVTIDTVVGAYTGTERKRLVVFCSPRESVKVKQFVAKLDDQAMITIIHVDNIWGVGTGFKAIGKEE